MIKRRFYRFEHGDRDTPSDSSSSDSEVEAEATDGTEVEDEEDYEVGEVGEKENESSSSGYESEDSSVNEVNLDSSGLPSSGDDMTTENGEQNIVGSLSRHEANTKLVNNLDKPEKNDTEFDMADCVVKCKSVFKCRLCPRIVCLSEETLKAHLNSKRHARSMKLQKEGRLKLMLNDDGKIEGETEIEKHATNTVSGQVSAKPKTKGKGRFKPKKRTDGRKLGPGEQRGRMILEERDGRTIVEELNCVTVIKFCREDFDWLQIEVLLHNYSFFTP